MQGHTDLTDAVITSSEQAVQDRLNRLETGTLAVRDIENHSKYKASSSGLVASIGFALPNITLHLHYSDQLGHLCAEQALQGKSADTQMWFCGPHGFADALQKGMQAQGCPARNFHKEYFQMR